MPYYRELKDGNKILKSKMLMLTKSDAIYVARCMNTAYGDFRYQAAPNFMGYEGADYGVNLYKNSDWKNYDHSRFVERMNHFELLKLCSDRPIVHQSKSWE